MKNTILVWFVIITAFARATVFAATLDELAGPGRAVALRAGGSSIVEVQLKNPGPRLTPRHGELENLIAATMGSLEPNILVETLSCYAKPRRTAADSGAPWSETERAGLFNQVLALSTLTGIQYYSASRGTMRTFYESSQVIDGPDTKRVIPDPVYAEPPAALTLYARQKDLTFGDNLYRYDYQTRPDAFFFVQ